MVASAQPDRPDRPVRSAVLWRSFLVFVPLALAAAAMVAVLYHVQSTAIEAVVRANERKSVEIAALSAIAELDSVVSDLRYLARQPMLAHWLESRDPEDLEAIAADFLAFSTEKASYDQIRLLDGRGSELVRVNWNDGTPEIVAEDDLQDKSPRFYVTKTLALPPGGIYVSPFDLNVERGVIEEPIKPMIRLGIPVLDRDGRRSGAVVINFLGQRLLDRIAESAASGPESIWLLNDDGHWLLGPDTGDAWAFMYPGRERRSFAARFPDAWERIKAGDGNGQFFAGGDLVTVERVVAIPEKWTGAADPAPGWFLVSRVPASAIRDARLALVRDHLVAFVGLAILFAIVAVVIARHGVRRDLADARVRAGEARIRAILESAPDATIISDPDGKVVLVNGEAERMFDQRRDRLIGRSIDLLLPERWQRQHPGHRARYVADARPRPMAAGRALTARRRDGSEVPVAVSLSPVSTDEGTLIVSSVRDMSEWQAAERRIADLNERLLRDNASLASVNEELEAFSYSVSHDLRAPLRAIDGFSQALMEDCGERLDEEGRGYLDRVRKAAQRMGELIDDMLMLSRVTRAEMAIRDVDLTALAGEVVAALRAVDPDREVEIAIASPMQARGDPRLLRIALDNLLANAWKFTAGRAPARIEIGQQTVEGETVHFVRDNGTGFDMAHAAQLFRAFHRLHDAEEFPGTGIGLATVQRIVNKHGGRVWVEAERGCGATFFFTL